MAFFWTLVAMVVVLALCWRFLGAYMVAVYEGRTKWLTWVERPIYRALRVDPQGEQTWPRYATSVIVFSGVALLITYGIFRLQGYLPFNPNHFPAVRADTAWNTAVSFVTNTNWQSYSGETTMSYLVPDGRPCGAELPVRCGGHGGCGRTDPRVRAQRFQDDRQLLGRPGAQHHLHPVADRLHRRDRLHLPGRGADPRRRRARPQRAGRRRPDPAARPRSPHKR